MDKPQAVENSVTRRSEDQPRRSGSEAAPSRFGCGSEPVLHIPKPRRSLTESGLRPGGARLPADVVLSGFARRRTQAAGEELLPDEVLAEEPEDEPVDGDDEGVEDDDPDDDEESLDDEVDAADLEVPTVLLDDERLSVR